MKASIGKIILTPPDFMGGPLGKPLAGYSPAPMCAGKYDDVMAHAVLIEETYLGNINKRMLLVSTDYLKIPLLWTDYVKEKIEEKYQIHPNQIMIHAIHTHKSFDMCGEFVFGGGVQNTIRGIMFGGYHGDDKYRVWAARQIVKLVGQLIKKLRPAKIAWSKKTITDHIIVNRRHPERKSQHKLGVITLKDSKTNELFGIISNFGMHPTTLANFVDKMSADYPGRIIEKIEELSEGKIEAAFFNEAAGDINPITTISKDYDFLAKQPQDYLLDQKGDLKETKELGYLLGEESYKLAKSIPDDAFFDKIDFKTYVKTFWVPMKDYTKYRSKFRFSQRITYLAKRYLLFPIALILGDANTPNFPGFAVKHKGIFRPGSVINVYSFVQYMRLVCGKSDSNETKELDFCGMPGEVFEDIAADVHKRTPAGSEGTFVIQNANDWISYLFPMKEYTTAGGYEPFASFSPYSGDFVKFAFFRLLKDIETEIIAGYY